MAFRKDAPSAVAHRDEWLRGQRRLSLLDAREKTIIEMRFGLKEGSEPHTLAQIAKKLGISRERVRQIEDLTMDKMKKILSEREG